MLHPARSRLFQVLSLLQKCLAQTGTVKVGLVYPEKEAVFKTPRQIASAEPQPIPHPEPCERKVKLSCLASWSLPLPAPAFDSFYCYMISWQTKKWLLKCEFFFLWYWTKLLIFLVILKKCGQKALKQGSVRLLHLNPPSVSVIELKSPAGWLWNR